MKILVLNSGSSSIKFQLFSMKDEEVLCKGLIEQIGEKVGHLSLEYLDIKYKKEINIKDHFHGIELIQSLLKEKNIIDDFKELFGVGHRVVHGGEYFETAVLIDDSVVDKIKELSPLAPLHNPVNLLGIEAISKKYPFLKQVGVFDTAFHQTLPKYAYLYALPYKYYKKEQIRRYGFHGTSHQYIFKKVSDMFKKNTKDTSLITLHLGNGASVAAIKNGKSIDTSMGFTPLEGLVMGTRCGDMDPAIVFYLCEKLSIDTKEIDDILNKQSGLKGICGLNDMREIEDRVKNGDRFAKLAIEIFCYRIKKYIGAYIAVVGKVDAIVFTGGIGENSSMIREKACEGLWESIGIDIDIEKNQQNNIQISTKKSKIKVLVVKTDEELEIARQTYEVVKNGQDDESGF